MRTANRESYLAAVNELQEEMMKLRPSIESVRMVYSEFTSAVIEYIWENNLKTEDFLSDLGNYLECINSKETIAELNNWVSSLFDEVVQQVNDKNKTRTTHIVEKARSYIEAHYEEADLSLEEISARIFVNPSYLSKVFKREMKYTIIEYLTHLRLKKAKEMMDDCPDMQISFVAKKVGYLDPFYFSKLFKKNFGISPSKYVEKK